jgi:signal peptidase I
MSRKRVQVQEEAVGLEAEVGDPGVVLFGPQDFASLSSEVLGSGKRLRFRAKGGSMHPFIRNGDLLVVEPAGGSAVRLGEVAFYRTENGGIAAHRVVGKRGRGGREFLATKGDAVRGTSHAVASSEVLGRVVAIEREGTEVRLDGGRARAVALVYVASSRFADWVCAVLSAMSRVMRGIVTTRD